MKYSYRSLFFLGMLLASLVSAKVLAEKPIQIIEPDQLLLIGKDISYFEDQEGSLELQDILKDENQQNFIDHTSEVFNRPGTESVFWFKITVQNYTQEDAWLEVGSNYAWYIDFYAPDRMGQYNNPIETGTMRPDSHKLYDVNFFWLPLNKANEHQSKTYYVKVVSGLTFELPLQVGTLRSLVKNKFVNDYLTAGFIGIILIMLLYNLFIYISTRDHIYLYYLGYLFFMAFSMPYANGYPFIEKINFLFMDKSFWNTYFLVWHSPAYFFAGAFCIQYLDLKSRGPLIRRLIQLQIVVLAVVFPLLNILGFQFVELVNVVQVSILVFYLTCLITSYYFVSKGFRQAYFYAFGWTFLITGAFIFFAVINGFLPFNPFTRNALYFGVAIEVGLFSLAMANRLNELRKEKDQVRAENLQLIQDQNEILEQKVKNRTTELETANLELSQSNEELLRTSEQLNAQGKQLMEVNKTKDRLFAIIGHDLRSPINSLKGLLNLMYNENISQKEFLKHALDAKYSVEHVHFMLNNLLNWARFQMQGMSTKPKIIDLTEIVSENIKLFHETSKNKHITVVNDISNVTKLFADYNHINLVIRNLLSNALKFTESGGKVEFQATTQGNSCEISISDSGTGIPPYILQGIFSNKSSNIQVGTDGEKGTGLGLPLCKYFIEKNNGEISVKSKVGDGTIFYLVLPTSMN